MRVATSTKRLLLLLLFSALILWAAAETVRPTSITAQSGYTNCTVGEIDEDPDSPDSEWCDVGGANNVVTLVTAAQADPIDNPVATSNAQEVRVQVRKTNHSTNPTCSVDILENGSLILNDIISTAVSSTTGTVLSATWTYTGFTNADGSGLEVRVNCAVGGGAASNRASGEVGAIELNLETAEAPTRNRFWIVGDD